MWEHELINFSNGTSLIPITKNKQFIIIDEAQKIHNIGTNLKILYDSIIPIKIIVTGSSSIDIAQAVSEPLTGRMIDFCLYPLCLDEIHQQYDIITLSKNLDQYMTYGMYPAVITEEMEFKKDKIKTIANNYLYKDILQIEGIKKPDMIIKLIKLLALQIGNQVSYHELATKLQIHQETVIKYIELLEKTFVIYRLHAWSGNIRNEITRSVKIYFWDLGVRNTILQDRGDISNRGDA
jgi:predicted AAA+ superfamily ATPase